MQLWRDSRMRGVRLRLMDTDPDFVIQPPRHYLWVEGL
jgi:hypothetical protein